EYVVKLICEKSGCAKNMVGILTITFGERVENHVGMQMLGELRKEGFTTAELKNLCDKISDSELYEMSYKGQEGSVLVIRNAVQIFDLTNEELLEEHAPLLEQYDRTFYNRQANEVQNKQARYNACFTDTRQASNPEEKKGIVFSFAEDAPLLAHIRDNLGKVFGEKAENLLAEGN